MPKYSRSIFTLTAALLGLTILFVSCNSSEHEAASESKAEKGTPSRPDTIQTELTLEGMTQPMRMYLLEPPDSFPLDFSTYIPADMETEVLSFEEAITIRIIANFGGQLNRKAYLMIAAYKIDLTAAEAHNRTQIPDAVPVDSSRFPWAETEYSIKGEGSNYIALAQKDGHWFFLRLSYPPEYGDGMGPRVNKIIEQWQWADGSRLEK